MRKADLIIYGSGDCEKYIQICLGLPTIEYDKIYGGLAQLARAPALHAGGQRFESVILHTPLKKGKDL